MEPSPRHHDKIKKRRSELHASHLSIEEPSQKREPLEEDAYREINFIAFRKSFSNLTKHYIVSSNG